MVDAHAHHILFKIGYRGQQQALVQEGQHLLRKVSIDPLFGEEVLYWAPNRVDDQHSGATLLILVEDLRKAGGDDLKKKDYQTVVRILAKHAKIAAKRE